MGFRIVIVLIIVATLVTMSLETFWLRAGGFLFRDRGIRKSDIHLPFTVVGCIILRRGAFEALVTLVRSRRLIWFPWDASQLRRSCSAYQSLCQPRRVCQAS